MLDHPNVLFLTPLSKVRYIYADILPFSDKKIISDKPIYIIQGAICRRYLPLLIRILDEKYKYDFFIKIILNIKQVSHQIWQQHQISETDYALGIITTYTKL